MPLHSCEPEFPTFFLPLSGVSRGDTCISGQDISIKVRRTREIKNIHDYRDLQREYRNAATVRLTLCIAYGYGAKWRKVVWKYRGRLLVFLRRGNGVIECPCGLHGSFEWAQKHIKYYKWSLCESALLVQSNYDVILAKCERPIINEAQPLINQSSIPISPGPVQSPYPSTISDTADDPCTMATTITSSPTPSQSPTPSTIQRTKRNLAYLYDPKTAAAPPSSRRTRAFLKSARYTLKFVFWRFVRYAKYAAVGSLITLAAGTVAGSLVSGVGFVLAPVSLGFSYCGVWRWMECGRWKHGDAIFVVQGV